MRNRLKELIRPKFWKKQSAFLVIFIALPMFIASAIRLDLPNIIATVKYHSNDSEAYLQLYTTGKCNPLSTTEVGFSDPSSIRFDKPGKTQELALPVQCLDQVRLDARGEVGTSLTIESASIKLGLFEEEIIAPNTEVNLSAEREILTVQDSNVFLKSLPIYIVTIFLLSCLIYGYYKFLHAKLFARLIKSKAFKAIQKIADRQSNEDLIVFDRKVIITILLGILAFLIAMLFQLHTSSIEAWDYIVDDGKPGFETIIGSPKGIRADEWNFGTPMKLSQEENDYDISSYNLGPDNSVLISNTPSDHVTTLFRPQHWGYLLGGSELGFLLMWNYYIFAISFGMFFLLLILTRNKFWLSLSFALLFFFSGYTQWWFSSIISEVLSALLIMLVALLYFIASTKKSHIIAAATLLTIFLPNFILSFYPAYQISLGYLALAIAVGFLIRHKEKVFTKEMLKVKLPLLTLSMVITAVVLYLFYNDSKEAIERILSTSYPGARFISGGGLTIGRYFSGFFNYYSDQNNFLKQLGNVCEASAYILLWPMLIATLYPYKNSKIKLDPVLVMVAIFVSLVSFWQIFYIPQVSEFLSKYTLFYMVPETRAIPAVGLGSMIVSVLILNHVRELKETTAIKIFLLNLIVLALIAAIFWLEFPEGMPVWMVVLSVPLISLLITALFKQYNMLALVIILLLSSPNIFVNPLDQGLDGVKDYPFVQEMKKHEGNWVVWGDPYIVGLLRANGLKVFNGTKLIPPLEELSHLDPTGEKLDIYNRYAHINIHSDPKSPEIKIELVANDAYLIVMQPCSEQAKEFGWDNILFRYDPVKAKEDLSCLNKGYTDTNLNLYVYTYK